MATLLRLTSPPTVRVVLGQPFVTVVVCGALGAFVAPFPALTLVRLPSSSRTPSMGATGGCPTLLVAAAAFPQCSASTSCSGSSADAWGEFRDTPHDTRDTGVTGWQRCVTSGIIGDSSASQWGPG